MRSRDSIRLYDGWSIHPAFTDFAHAHACACAHMRAFVCVYTLPSIETKKDGRRKKREKRAPRYKEPRNKKKKPKNMKVLTTSPLKDKFVGIVMLLGRFQHAHAHAHMHVCTCMHIHICAHESFNGERKKNIKEV